MNDRKINFSLVDAAGTTKNFTTLRSLHDFSTSERDFWQSQIKKIENPRHNHAYMNASGMFGTIVNMIDQWKDNLDTWDQIHLDQQLNALRQGSTRNSQTQWLWSGQPYVEAYVTCVMSGGDKTAQAFLDYVLKRTTPNLQQIESYNGYLHGYEFVNQESTITKRRYSEKSSLTHLRNQFSETRDKLFSEADELKRSFIVWDENNRIEADRIIEAQKLAGDAQTKDLDNKFDEKFRDWAKTISELESTYQEKLRLEKPAEYWRKSARRYGIQGGLWSLALVALSLLGLINFHEIFTGWLNGKQLGLQFHTVQGLILFGSIAAIYAFLMRVLSRLTFSAFHLMRDSEEREQLTYLYLALTNQSAVDEKSRDIILQSLFSRSETGLLAQEHGPTMPGIGDIASAATRTRG